MPAVGIVIEQVYRTFRYCITYIPISNSLTVRVRCIRDRRTAQGRSGADVQDARQCGTRKVNLDTY